MPHDTGRPQKTGSKAPAPLTQGKLCEGSMVLLLRRLFLCVEPCAGRSGKDDLSRTLRCVSKVIQHRKTYRASAKDYLICSRNSKDSSVGK